METGRKRDKSLHFFRDEYCHGQKFIVMQIYIPYHYDCDHGKPEQRENRRASCGNEKFTNSRPILALSRCHPKVTRRRFRSDFENYRSGDLVSRITN